MRIHLASDTDRSAWDAFVAKHPEGLAYHFYAWKQAVEQAYGFRGYYLLAEEEQGKVRGVLPLIHLKRPWWGGKLVSLPYCDVGGVLADDPDAETALVARAEALARELRAGGPELRQARPPAAEPPQGCGPGKKVRMLLELPGDAETLLAGLKSKLRSQVKKPEREGLQARLGGAELLDDFYRVFAENMRDLGSPVHSKGWLGSVVEHFGARARIGVAYSPAGLPAAAGVILLHPRTVSIPWASALRRFNHLNPNMLLYWTLLAFAADTGHANFDFGRSTIGEGTYRFKEQWGARPSPLFWQDFTAPAAAGATGPAVAAGRRIAELLWSRLPLRMTTLLGPPLRRNISL